MPKIIGIVAILVIIGIAGFIFFNKNQGNQASIPTQNTQSSTSTNSASNANWQQYTPLAEGNFQILFPSTPQKQTSKPNISNPQQPIYVNVTELDSALDSNTVFQVTVVPLPQVQGMPSGIALLKALTPMVVSSIPSPTVISSNETTFKTYVAYVYILKDSNNAFHKYTFFQVPSNNNIYVLSESSTSDAFQYYDKFVNSFQVLGQ